MKTVFVDANNLMWRTAWASSDLTHEGKPTGMSFGFFRSLNLYREKYPLHHVVIVWDGGHAERDEISKAAVAAGIIPSAYKANRGVDTSESGKLIRWQVDQQLEPMKEALAATSFQQVQRSSYETDDIIATYTISLLGKDDHSVIASSDKDFYQLLAPNVIIDDRMKSTIVTLDSWREMTGLTDSELWIDIGALAGDAGDNIFGVPGVGEATAIKFVKQYGTVDKVFAALRAKKEARVALSKKEENVLAADARVLVALQLKAMNPTIPDLPSLQRKPGDVAKLAAYFESCGFESLQSSVNRFV